MSGASEAAADRRLSRTTGCCPASSSVQAPQPPLFLIMRPLQNAICIKTVHLIITGLRFPSISRKGVRQRSRYRIVTGKKPASRLLPMCGCPSRIVPAAHTSCAGHPHLYNTGFLNGSLPPFSLALHQEKGRTGNTSPAFFNSVLDNHQLPAVSLSAMFAAALLPSPMARMTVAPPRTMSPPA